MIYFLLFMIFLTGTLIHASFSDVDGSIETELNSRY